MAKVQLEPILDPGALDPNAEAESFRVSAQEGTRLAVGDVISLGDLGELIRLRVEVAFEVPRTGRPSAVLEALRAGRRPDEAFFESAEWKNRSDDPCPLCGKIERCACEGLLDDVVPDDV